MENKLKKRVTMDLTQINGNAFALLGAFRAQARKEGWSQEEITFVLTYAMDGDYDHLVAVLLTYSQTSNN